MRTWCCLVLLSISHQIGQVLAFERGKSASDSMPVGWSSRQNLGCYMFLARLPSPLPDMPIKGILTAEVCQTQCQQLAECVTFGYLGISHECYLSSSLHITISNDTFQNGGLTGPKFCPDPPPMCTASPSRKFPGFNADESNSAWPTHQTPPNLQCWPHGDDAYPKLCNAEPVRVLEDSDLGWRGNCQGLKRTSLSSSKLDCAQSCKSNVWCSVWVTQLSLLDNRSVECWQGLGDDCFARHTNAMPLASQRLMHGHFRVLMNVAGLEIRGLVPTDVLDGITQLTLEPVAIQRCNHTCLSLLNCQVWQYSSQDGCRIEHPGVGQFEYPPTRTSWLSDTPYAKTVIAGEYIQRLCGSFRSKSAYLASLKAWSKCIASLFPTQQAALVALLDGKPSLANDRWASLLGGPTCSQIEGLSIDDFELLDTNGDAVLSKIEVESGLDLAHGDEIHSTPKPDWRQDVLTLAWQRKKSWPPWLMPALFVFSAVCSGCCLGGYCFLGSRSLSEDEYADPEEQSETSLLEHTSITHTEELHRDDSTRALTSESRQGSRAPLVPAD